MRYLILASFELDLISMTIDRSPRFQAVVPGGDAFEIPQGTLTNTTNEGLGFNWTVSVRPGTSVIIVGSDDRGYGSGGSTLFPGVQQGNLSCINEKSLSSTSGAPMSTNTRYVFLTFREQSVLTPILMVL